MSRKTLPLNDDLYSYMLSISLREHPILTELRDEIATMPLAGMQTAPEEAQFLALLVELTAAKKVLEVGVFKGYSSTRIALALPPDGRLVGCDISDEFTQVARRYWKRAGVAEKIDLLIGPALDTLQGLLDAGEGGSFDLAYIDADKVNYGSYYERVLQLVRTGGLIAIDNVLWGGRVINPENNTPETLSIREFNKKLAADRRVTLSLVPIGDGLALARKR